MQTLTVDVFVSVDGWASGATSPGYFGYFGPDLELVDHRALDGRVLLVAYRPSGRDIPGAEQ